jgi:hypothetical protein
LTKTIADFVAIFDAGVISQRNFLMRTIGFFANPSIGVIQVRFLQLRFNPIQFGIAKDIAGRPAVFLRCRHAEPRRLECSFLLRLKLGDASGSVDYTVRL